MSLYDKYAAQDDDYIFVNFIEGQFERRDFKSLISKEYTDKFVIEFKPTDKCNFDCSYCCFHDNKAKPCTDEMFENYKTVIRNMNIDKDEIFLFLYGGEPTRHPKLVDYIIELNDLFPGKTVKTLIQSNGMFWKLEEYKTNCQRLIDHGVDFVFSFSYHREFCKISELKPRIDYLMSIETHGHPVFECMTYMITKENVDIHIAQIKILQQTNIPVYVRTILQESEWFLTSKYKQYITTDTHDPYMLVDTEGVEHSYGFEDLTMRGYLNFKGYSCSAGQNAILMGSNGKIFRCDMDFLYDRNEIYNVNESLEPKYEIDNCLKCDHKFCSIYYGDKWDQDATDVSHHRK
jgi:sulfatase maturation enzyme AslB (radical SAM superfamily)